MINRKLIIVRGAGDLATGTIAKLHNAGFAVIALEVPKPSVIRRTVAFAQAVFDGETTVEGLKAIRVDSPDDSELIEEIIDQGCIPIVVDPKGESISELRPYIVVDAILAKRNLGTTKDMAPIVIGLGPGFEAGVDVDAVIETMRGHYLGRVIYQGKPIPDTGVPGEIAGHSADRVVKAPVGGRVYPLKQIGDLVEAEEPLLKVDDTVVESVIAGVVRGMIQEGFEVTPGFKIADVDPRDVREHCNTISDKARAIAGGVLEAILSLGEYIV